jgi:hypothetical protein
MNILLAPTFILESGHNPEDRNMIFCRREYLKSYIGKVAMYFKV